MLILALATLSWATTMAFFYPADCNSNCECEGPSVACVGGIIPKLDERLTHFTIKNADPPIENLTSSIALQLDHLVSLYVISSGLENIEGGAFSKIPRLENLEITHNKIKSLDSKTFTDCIKLINLNLDNNHIEAIDNNAFRSLESLETLSLAHNSIKSLPAYFPPSIESFNIEDNRIDGIPAINIPGLSSINLCSNGINSSRFIEIEMENIIDICLGGSTFKLEREFINSKKFPKLGKLKLVGSQESPLIITDSTQRNIVNMTSRNLRTLTLESCRLHGLALFNQRNSKLQKIKASNISFQQRNDNSPRTAQTIRLPSVEIFDVSGSPTLAALFIRNPTQATLTGLKELRLSACNIKTFPEFILSRKAPNITKLDLSHNPLHCTCSDLSWVKRYVFDGKISLIKEEKTLCNSPLHLKGKPVILATMCPVTAPPSVATKASTIKPDIRLGQTEEADETKTTESIPQFNLSTESFHYITENATEMLPTEFHMGNDTEYDPSITAPDSKIMIIVLAILTIVCMVAIISVICLDIYKKYLSKSTEAND